VTLLQILAWLLPIGAGVALWLAFNPLRGPGWIAAALGHGIVVGLLLAGAATWMFARDDTAHAVARAGPWLTLFALAMAIIAWRRSRPVPQAAQTQHVHEVKKWKIALAAVALTSLVWRGWIAWQEILLRPTFPWDAWDAWAVKSKTWFLLGHYAPFVSMRDWLAQVPADAYTGPGWSYPASLGWMQVWCASAGGDWVEPMVNLPWLALWIGLLLGHYGQWRALGLERTRALAFVYLLGSLPLIDVHVALAGYADLWIAALFGFAALAWMRWIERGERSQLAIAVVCALAMPMLKLEGGVWLSLFACVMIFGLLPRRWRTISVAVIAAVLVVGIAVGRLALPLFGLGWVGVGLSSIDVPVIGKLAIAWHGSAFSGVLASLFVQPSWNLLWWLAPMVICWRWRELRANASLRLLGFLLVACLGFLMFLFLLTDAARWAESFTAINRLVMHLAPAVVTLLALLLRRVDLSPELRDTAPASAGPTHPS
jgi:hypothetical protein